MVKLRKLLLTAEAEKTFGQFFVSQWFFSAVWERVPYQFSWDCVSHKNMQIEETLIANKAFWMKWVAKKLHFGKINTFWLLGMGHFTGPIQKGKKHRVFFHVTEQNLLEWDNKTYS